MTTVKELLKRPAVVPCPIRMLNRLRGMPKAMSLMWQQGWTKIQMPKTWRMPKSLCKRHNLSRELDQTKERLKALRTVKWTKMWTKGMQRSSHRRNVSPRHVRELLKAVSLSVRNNIFPLSPCMRHRMSRHETLTRAARHKKRTALAQIARIQLQEVLPRAVRLHGCARRWKT